MDIFGHIENLTLTFSIDLRYPTNINAKQNCNGREKHKKQFSQISYVELIHSQKCVLLSRYKVINNCY